jgi:tRNA (guanine37-N1)-methyltransferase
MILHSTCVIVPKQEGERIRKKLSELGILNTECLIQKEPDRLIIPVNASTEYVRDLDLGPDVIISEGEFEAKERRPYSYKELLGDLPLETRERLPTSFDVVGDIVIIKLEEDLITYATRIGEALLEAQPSIKSCALDKGVTGSFRVRDLEVICGRKSTETVHIEYGMRFHVDPARAYFSPRLATERSRITSFVQPGEKIIDMFAGVGPFSISIARNSRPPGPEKIWAIEINPDAIEYLGRNIEENNVGGLVVPVLGDAREKVSDLPKADRIIMNLPHDSSSFIGIAMDAAASGATIHFYEIMAKDTDIQARYNELAGDMPSRLLGHRIVHSYTPAQNLVCLDIVREKKIIG